ELRGDFVPACPAMAQIDDAILFLRKQRTHALQQFAPADLHTRTRISGGGVQERVIAARRLAVVALLTPCSPGGRGQLVPRYRDPKVDELRVLLKVVLACGRTHEKARHDRLADVHRIEEPVEPAVLEAHPDLAANERFVLPYEFNCCLLVASPNARDE